MAEDIRKTGPVGLKGLPGVNRMSDMSLEDQWKIVQSTARSNPYMFSSPGSEPIGLAAMDAGYGNSQYDEGLTSESQLNDLNEIRYQNQPWYDTLANGVGKMLGTATTTFLSSLIGLPYGAVQTASEGRFSALWDNDVTQILSDADHWLDENMTNYKSQKQQNSPWYDPSNLFSMNFIADDIIKNMGFMQGAAAAMVTGEGGLGLLARSLGFVGKMSSGTKMATNFMSALFSATGEGMIEARQGVEERNKLEFQKFDDELMPYYQALDEQQQQINQQYSSTGDYNTYSQQMQDLLAQRQQLDQRREAGRQQIVESGQDMGNMILGANQVLLTVGNLIQFGKAMTKSFDAARHAAEMSSKYAKPFGVSAARTAKGTYEITGKNLGSTVALTKGLFTEGSEEMNQQWIQNTAGNYYNREDVNDYWKAQLDPDAVRDTSEGLYTLGSAINKGFQDSWGDGDQWEQFVVGGLTGLAGSYTPTKLFNQDKTKKWFDPRRYGSWEGGAVRELMDFNHEYQQYQENIDDVNKILQQEDFPARVKNMIAHTYLENQKNDAANRNDMKAWKDADDKQTIHDIQAFLRAGKLDDLRAIYQEMGRDLSDDDIENIVKSTTKEISANEDKRNFDQSIDEQIGQHQRKITELNNRAQSIADSQETLKPEERGQYQVAVSPALEDIHEQIDKEYAAIDNLNQQKENYTGQTRYEGSYVDNKRNRTKTNDEIREEIKHNAEELNRKLDSYLDSIDYVNRRTNGQLTKEQEDNLAYLHNMGKESQIRMQKIMGNVRRQLPSKFLLKTNKTPEQLSQENASSDLVFSKDENTKEGYVEVDTSAMNDAAFADFFQREVMRGGNIMPEFAETADEKAVREADEKNLSEEEKKKKARERASKKWQQAIEKMQQDAEEQWDTNWKMLVDNFMDNYSRQGNTNLDETIEAFGKVRQDLQDASELFDQTGEFQKTLMEYMQNPGLADKAREKEEKKADKANEEQQQKNKFAGKDAKQMNQEIADGTLNIDDLDDFASADLSDVTDDDVKAAQEEAKKSQGIRQKQASLKQHIQDSLDENPTQEELDAAQMAMQMVDSAALNAEDPSDISIDMPELGQIPLDQVDPNASIDDVDTLNQQVQGMLADAFNAMQEDENAQDDIPEEIPEPIDDVGAPAPETGHDPILKTPARPVAPSTPASATGSEAASNQSGPKIVLKNNLTEGAIDKIVEETRKVTSNNTNGTWRSCTTRHLYHRSDGTYHEDIAKPQFGENSVEYKRSKAIWEYLNSVGAFDRMDNSSEDRMKNGDTIHFMVMYLPSVFGARIEEVSDEDKPKALVILMLNDNGEVMGDLPLAEFEPSFKSGNPTQQVKDLKALQDKLFKAFYENHAKTGANMAVADGVLMIDGVENLNLTFDNAKKTPLVSRVKQTMRGVVPYAKTEKHTLNEVAAGTSMQLGVKVLNDDGSVIAIARGDRSRHTEIVAPNIGSIGQPYLLLPTPSGEKVAVPFYTKPFDVQQHQGTQMYTLLRNAIFYLITNNNDSAKAKEYFKKHMDVIEGLLQVTAQEGQRVVNVTPDTISLHLQSLTNPNQKYDISVPKTGNFAQDAVALVNQLNGIPINVSLEYLNRQIETGLNDNEKYAIDYNQVLGEIADINLPQNTTHTVNSWFTIELAPTTGIKPSKPLKPTATGTVVESIGGRNVEINTNNYTAVDTSTGEVISDDEQVNLRLAQIKASKPIYKDKEFIQISIGGDIRTYDVKNNRFVKKKENKPVSTPTQTASEEAPDIDVAPPASGAVMLREQLQQPTTSIIEIDVPTMAGGTRKEKVQKVSSSELKKGDLIWYSDPETENPIGQGTVAIIENGQVYLYNGLLSNVKAMYKVVPTNQQLATSGKTIQEIENEMKQNKTVTRQNKDAWAVIPDDLKLKLVNEGATLQVAFFNATDRVINNRVMTISMSNRPELIKVLSQANNAAKAGNMRVSEAVKPMEKNGVTLSREKEREARRWLAKNLPSLSSEERTQFVEKMARAGRDGGKMWGSYRAGVIEIQRNAPMGTVYHEAFHYVLDMILSSEERQAFLDIAKKEYGITDEWAAEEKLANDFRRYAMDENATGIVGSIKKWLRRLKDKITRYNRIEDSAVNQLFWKINNGEFAQRALQAENFEDNQQIVLREIRNVQKEKVAWRNLGKNTKQALRDAGLSEATYTNMSLEEKEQWLKCRT